MGGGSARAEAREDRTTDGNIITAAHLEPGHQLRLHYADGVSGTVDMAPLVARGGVFTVIAEEPGGVRVGPNGWSVEWTDAEGDTVDFCADALRMTLDVAAQQAAAE